MPNSIRHLMQVPKTESLFPKWDPLLSGIILTAPFTQVTLKEIIADPLKQGYK